MQVQGTRPTGPKYYGIQEVAAVEIVDDPDDEIWNVQLSSGEVRTVTLDKLNDLYRFSIIDESAFLWQPGMANWTRLGTLLGLDAPEPEEQFHVVFGQGNVKQVTLEQLDDYFRYGVIDERTLVWKKGLSEWQTLGKLAGLDAAAPQPNNAQRTAAPAVAAPQQQHTSRAPAVAAPQQQHTSRAPAVAAPQQQHTSRAPAVAAPQQQHTSRAAAQAAYYPSVAPSAVPIVRSAPPISFSIEPVAEKPNLAVRWLFRLAVAAGVTLALVRNDLVYSVASKTTLASRYAELEHSLVGGPSFGTERAVEHLVTDSKGHLEPVRLPLTVVDHANAQKRAAAQVPSTAEPSAKAATDAGASSASGTKTTAAAASDGKKTASSSPDTASKPATSAQPATLSAPTPAKSLSTMATATRGKSATTRSAPPARPSKKSSSSSKSTLRSGGNYFDPLNPSL